MLYSAASVTNWFIAKNCPISVELSHLKIQKLLYFAQGWHLAFFSCPLFEDPIEAWRHGPVVNSIYLALRKYKKYDNITEFVAGPVIIDGKYEIGIPKMMFPEKNRMTLWNFFGGLILQRNLGRLSPQVMRKARLGNRWRLLPKTRHITTIQ
jgi:hypothetical protein